MNTPSLSFQTPSRKTLFICLVAFLVFVTGFILLFGRNAEVSGSWKYVINDRDDYLYWAYAKGASEIPLNDGNPFYYEERGTTQAVPYTMSLIIGWVSRMLGVSVLTFFPVWYVLAPFVTWLVLWQCLYRFWRFPQVASACFALIFLLATLFIRNSGFQTIYRFSRPADALWALMLWISFVMTQKKEGKKALLLSCFSSAFVIWFNPFLAGLGLLVNFGEAVWQRAGARNREQAKFLFIIFTCSLLSTLAFFAYIKLNASQNPWVFKLFEVESAGARKAGVASLSHLGIDKLSTFWFGMTIAMIYASKQFLKLRISVLDRLLFAVTLVRFIFQNVHMVLPGKFEVADHCYHFIAIDLVVLIGWLREKSMVLIRNKISKKVAFISFATLTLITVFTLLSDQFTFFYIGIAPWSTHKPLHAHNNALFHISILPFLTLCIFGYLYSKKLRFVINNRYCLTFLIVILCFFGFYTSPTNTSVYRKNFPFEKAYEWLNQNAEKNEVVLTAPHRRAWTDYLILYTDLKTFIHPLGDLLAHGKLNTDNHFRFLFYFNLLTGDLRNVSFGSLKTIREKMKYLKLDYILVERDTPFLANIVRQVKDETNLIYQNKKFILMKIK